MSAATQLRLTDLGFGLPLKPTVLAELNEFERGHQYAVLDLDAEQEACAEQAVGAVKRGEYGEVQR